MQLIDIATDLTPAAHTARTRAGDVKTSQLLELYGYPANLKKPWVRANFVSSIDGAAAADGASAGLGTDSDHTVFTVLRGLADVILVGAGTVRAENYGGAQMDEDTRFVRSARGQQPVPPIAVVTTSASIDPESKLLTDTDVAPLIFTCTSAPKAQRDALTDAGAKVFELGSDSVPIDAIVAKLTDLGLLSVLCEGGPSLVSKFLDEDVLDDFCLTTSPSIALGDAGRVAHSENFAQRSMRRAHVLSDDDGTLLVRWVRRRDT